jgi:hypothetical protein
METLSIDQKIATKAQSVGRVIPTYVYATVFSSLCIVIGLIWDISWHISIGRDGLLSPPHLAIYLGAIVAGTFSGFKVLKVSFWGSAEEKAQNVHFWGIFYASLGAMFCIWGAFAMLTSAPFDDWWHNTYGLDVTILSPPHSVLGLGMITVQFGAMISVLALHNRLNLEENPQAKTTLYLLYTISAGILIAMVSTFASEYMRRGMMHSVLFYQVVMAIFPLFMCSIAYAARFRWAATRMALVYTLILWAMVIILPLFPAEPLLGPILYHIDRFQPYQFPLLLIVPAIGIDLVLNNYKSLNGWWLSLLLPAVFLALFFPAQWFFADFLQTPAARGHVFGQSAWYYANDPNYAYRFAFAPWQVSSGWELVKGLFIAYGLGVISTRIGISWGNWMKQVQR